MGRFSSNDIPRSFKVSKTASLAIFTTVLLTCNCIVDAPFSVILGAIAFIFSFTVYTISALFISLLNTDIMFFEKSFVISIDA